MSFRSGRVSFCRMNVVGDAPQTVDDAALSILAQHAFVERESAHGTPEEIESGFITGEHLLDTQFSFEKNGFGDPPGSMLLFALRVDINKVPSELRFAQRRINELAMAAQNPSGFASKAQKRDAKDAADRQVAAELAAGKHRRSKSIPVLWDLSTQTLFVGSTSNKVHEQLAMKMRMAFEVSLENLTSGAMANKLLSAKGLSRDFDDLRPSALTPAPNPEPSAPGSAGGSGGHEESREKHAEIPTVPWAEASDEPKDFLGNEFLLWLWWQTETAEGLVPVTDDKGKKHEISILLDRSLDMDCAWGRGGKQSLRGSGPTRMSEAGEALLCGKWPRKAGMMLADKEAQFELSLQADKLTVSGSSLPEVADAESPRQILEARLLLTRQLSHTLDLLYSTFLALRVSQNWSTKRGSLRKWITQRNAPHA